MKGKIIVSRFWTRFFSWGKATAVTIFPFIFLLKESSKKDPVLINHERIHLVQALELLVLPFYLWYVIEFLIRYVQYGNFHVAYRNICFEKEAYDHEKNLNHIRSRRFWFFLRYLRR